MSDASAPPHVSEQHLRRLERVYHAAPTNRLIPATMVIAPGSAQLRMRVTPEHLQAVGSVHGFLYFKALDECAFYASNSLVDDVFLTTASLNVQFLQPLQDDEMFTTAQVIHAARSSVVADAEVRDAAERLLARGTGTFVRSRTPLPAL